MIAGLGLFVGLILGLTGAGGAILAVPLLIFALDWDVARSAPVALVAVAASAALGAVLGLRQRCVRYRAATVMAVTGAVVTPGGLWLARRVPVAPLALLFSAVLLYVAWRMYSQTRSISSVHPVAHPARVAPCQINHATGRFRWTAPCARALALSGIATGFLSGLLGVGGGFVIVPALRHATDLPMNSIVATSLMVVALVSSFAVAASALTGNFDFAIAWPFATGALAGMLLGRVIAPKIAGQKLQQGFAALSAVVALGLIGKTLLAIHR
ncbi:MAG: sulfite exporter TauE/SafE family protein [Steroidobacteraceae bacterium]